MTEEQKEVVVGIAVLALAAAVVVTIIWAVGYSWNKVDELFCQDAAVMPNGTTAGITCDYAAKMEVTPKGQFVCRCKK